MGKNNEQTQPDADDLEHKHIYTYLLSKSSMLSFQLRDAHNELIPFFFDLRQSTLHRGLLFSGTLNHILQNPIALLAFCALLLKLVDQIFEYCVFLGTFLSRLRLDLVGFLVIRSYQSCTHFRKNDAEKPRITRKNVKE